MQYRTKILPSTWIMHIIKMNSSSRTSLLFCIPIIHSYLSYVILQWNNEIRSHKTWSLNTGLIHMKCTVKLMSHNTSYL